MLASQSFITSVVVGKDIVPRIGLHQLEMLRHQLVETLHGSRTAKVSPVFRCATDRKLGKRYNYHHKDYITLPRANPQISTI